MKLILCARCSDVRKIHRDLVQCDCACSWGRYESNGNDAVYGGLAIPLSIDNYSLATTAQRAASGEVPANAWHGCYPYGPLVAAWVPVPNCSLFRRVDAMETDDVLMVLRASRVRNLRWWNSTRGTPPVDAGLQVELTACHARSVLEVA